jgi:catechol 2,3-dioxygenase-like lactoylglutathione lyase family enzyme
MPYSRNSLTKLVPELYVTDIRTSLSFWCGLIGFSVLYDRPEEGFAYLNLDGAHVMLEQRTETDRTWETAPFSYPLGRGINFQIKVPDTEPILFRLAEAGIPLFMNLEEKWYRADNVELGQKQFLVMDPDGYLLRLIVDLGERGIIDNGK